MLRQAREIFIVHVQVNISTNSFFGQVVNFSTILELQQNVFRVLTRSFRQRGHNCIVHVHRNILRKFFSFRKNHNFFRRFQNLSGKSVGFWRKVFGRFVKIAFSVARESFLMKKKQFCSKNYIFISFGILESFSSSCRQCYGRLAKFSLCTFR